MKLRAHLLLAMLLATATPGFAQDSVETAKRQELEEIRRQVQEKRAAAQRLKGVETQALGQLKRTDRELSLTRRRLRSLQVRHQQLGQDLEVTRVSLQRSIESLQAQRAKLRHRLRSLYKYGPARELEYMLSTHSFAQLMTRWDFLTMIAQQDRLLLDDVREEKAKVEASKQKLESTLGQVDQTAKLTTSESRKLAELREKREKGVKTIQSQRQSYEAAAAELERTARRIQQLLATLERRRREEADKARAEGRNPQPYSGDFARGEGQLDWPVRGELVGHFGPEKHPRFNTSINNQGIDVSAPVGTAVKAVAKGRVDFVNEDYEGVGGVVILNHGDGYFTLYQHLSEVSVQNAQEVSPGQVIGRVGEEGSLKGPILHFEVRKGAAALNPEGWLR